MPDLLTSSKITVPVSGGTTVTYEIKDEKARQAATGAIQLKGTAITEMTDGSTTTPIVVGKLTETQPEDWAENYTQYYTYSKFTNVFTPVTGETAPEWTENTYYAGESLAAQDNYAVFYRAKEYVWDGNMWCEFGDMTGIGAMAYCDTEKMTGFTPQGEISGTVTGTATGSVSLSGVAASGTATGTTIAGVSVSGAAAGEGQTATYTPAGDITGGSCTASTTTIKECNNTASIAAGSLVTTYANETLSIEFTAPTMPTFTDTTVATGVNYTLPSFQGTGAILTSANITVPNLTVATTTDASQTASLTDGATSLTLNQTDNKLTFTGTPADIEVSPVTITP